jgi:hypothetical protein
VLPLAARSAYRVDFLRRARAAALAACSSLAERARSPLVAPRSAATDADALFLARRTRAVPPDTPPVLLSSMGQVTWPLRVAHVEWSPHVTGEAALMLEDGALHCYDVARALAAAAPRRTLPQLRGACACGVCMCVSCLHHA